MSREININIGIAKYYLGATVGNGYEYKKYCENTLAGDFAVDVCKVIINLEREVDELKFSKNWMESRLNNLQNERERFREPERTMLCCILANGFLDHVIRDYPERSKGNE